MTQAIFKFILFKIGGWTIEGNNPNTIKKHLFVVAPHTSNWDFVLGIMCRVILKINIRFIAKASLFRFPFGGFFRAMGGYPINRKKVSNFVNFMVNTFNKHEEFSVVITPEGTRSYNPNWKTGFYYIAKNAKIPIVQAGFDYSKKVITIFEPFFVGDDPQETIDLIKSRARTIKGKYPKLGVR